MRAPADMCKLGGRHCLHREVWGVRPGGLSGIHEGTRHRLAQREHRERAVDSGVSIRVWGVSEGFPGEVRFQLNLEGCT